VLLRRGHPGLDQLTSPYVFAISAVYTLPLDWNAGFGFFPRTDRWPRIAVLLGGQGEVFEWAAASWSPGRHVISAFGRFHALGDELSPWPLAHFKITSLFLIFFLAKVTLNKLNSVVVAHRYCCKLLGALPRARFSIGLVTLTPHAFY